MSRDEIIEWVIILLCVVVWWPRLFMNYDPLWYHVLIYYLVPLALIIIAVRRYRRMKAGLEYSEKVVQSQRYGQQPPSLDDDEHRR